MLGALPRPHSCLVWVASNKGDTQWRAGLEDGDASGGLSQDSALFSGSCIPAISVIISK